MVTARGVVMSSDMVTRTRLASPNIPQYSWLRDVAAGVIAFGVKLACLSLSRGRWSAALSAHAVDGWPLLPVTHDRRTSSAAHVVDSDTDAAALETRGSATLAMSLSRPRRVTYIG